MSATLTLRREVLAFAQAMERQLRKNDWKGGWKDCRETQLFERLVEESKELRGVLLGNAKDQTKVLPEAADVANFCMMVADVCGSLEDVPVIAQGPTPLQAAALAALVAWRKADKAMDAKSGRAYFAARVKMPPIEEKLRAIADALIAEGGTG